MNLQVRCWESKNALKEHALVISQIQRLYAILIPDSQTVDHEMKANNNLKLVKNNPSKVEIKTSWIIERIQGGVLVH